MTIAIRDWLKGFRGRLDAMVASILGLLTITSWAMGDATPLATLNHAADWLGWNISKAVSNVETWTNSEHRGDVIAIGCLVALAMTLGTHLHRLATDHRLRPAEKQADTIKEYTCWLNASDTRFWCVVLVVLSMLAQLQRLSWTSAAAIVLILLALRGAARAADDASSAAEKQKDWHWSHSILSVGYGAILDLTRLWATLMFAPRWLWAAIAEPHRNVWKQETASPPWGATSLERS